ncbi:MAG: anthranilate phosphoribosyltransferase, partial [Longimicrobiales bacterium]
TIGLAEEYIPLVAILITLCVGMRMDTVAAVGIMVVGYGIGYGTAVMNPFTVLVAQEVAGVTPVSGLWYRVAMFIPLFALGFWHVLRYARKVRADASSSLVADVSEAQPPEPPEVEDLNGRQKWVLVATLATLAVVVWGIKAHQWYFIELGGIFLGMAILVGLLAGLLVGLSAKGVAPSEVAGGVRALRTAMLPVASSDPDVLVDTAGTGGGTVTTFNISTAAAFVVAGAGVPVAKHGNRSFTSRSGSADVLEALGVSIDLTPERMSEVLEEAGIVFMFAPLLHPAMRFLGPVRRGLGIRTMMNILGPLTNPAGARRQVVGVADAGLLDLIPGALRELGHLRALVVHGSPGLDEVSPLGPTRVVELKDGELSDYELGLEHVGLSPVEPADIRGGDPEDNARIVTSVLAGDVGAPRTVVLLNAAAALLVADRADDWPTAVSLAEDAIDSGAAAAALERLRVSTSG